MKIIFMGTPDFSVGTLEALVEAGHEVVLAVTQPDKPKGRGKEMQFTPVKECALAHNIPVYQPKKIREPECIEELKKYQADVCVVVGFPSIEVNDNLCGVSYIFVRIGLEKTYFGERDAARKNKYSKFLCANHSDEPLRTGIMFGNGLHDSCVSSPLHKHGIFHIYFFWRLCSSNG